MAGPFRPSTRRGPAPRSFVQTLRRAAVMPMIGFAAAAAWMTGHAVAPTVPGLTDLAVTRPPASIGGPRNQPVWTPDDGSRFPGCHGRAAGAGAQEHGPLVVVVTQHGERKQVTWGHAWDLTHDGSRANDVWVIGDCPGT